MYFFITLIHFIFNYFSYICSMYSYFRLAFYSCSILKFLFLIRFHYVIVLNTFICVPQNNFFLSSSYSYSGISQHFFYSYISECLLRRKAGRYLHLSLQNRTSFVPLKNAVLSPLQDILKECYIFFYSCSLLL